MGQATIAVKALVGGDGLINPGAKPSDPSIHSRHGRSAGAAAPGDDTNQGPSSRFLAHKRATRVTLKQERKKTYA